MRVERVRGAIRRIQAGFYDENCTKLAAIVVASRKFEKDMDLLEEDQSEDDTRMNEESNRWTL